MSERLLQAQELAYQYPGQPRPLFENVSFSVYEGEKLALMGLNGSGKTTLLELLLGRRAPSGGTLQTGAQPTWVPQDELLQGGGTVRDTLLEPWPGLGRLHADILRMEAEGLPEPLRYAEQVAAFHVQGGFELLAQAEKTLADVGMAADILSRPVASLSGGERRLLRLAVACAAGAGLTLLDEPTNYLDAAGTERLVAAIHASDRAFLIVSHDRWFLDQTVGRVLELDRGGLESYRGDYSTFAATKAATRRHKLRQKEKLETEIGKLQEMERTYKVWGARKEKEKSGAADKGFVGARAARLAKRGILAKERIHERAEKLREARPWVDKDYEIAFEPVVCPTGTCLAVRGLGYAVGPNELLHGLSFSLEWGVKVAIVGANGAGKSTLIRLLLGELEPEAGEILWSRGVKIGYLPQLWNPALDRATAASLFTRDLQPRARTLLGCLRVPGESWMRPLGELSEGQKRKALLVRLILEAPNLLVLDEPTTHLDYRSVEMFEEALQGYQGTVLLVSHDRYLRERVAGREIEVGKARGG